MKLAVHVLTGEKVGKRKQNSSSPLIWSCTSKWTMHVIYPVINIVHTCRSQLGFFSSKLVTGSILSSTLTEICLLLPASLPCFSLKPLHVKDKSYRPSLTLISPGIYLRHLVQKLFIYVRVTWENRLLKVLPG